MAYRILIVEDDADIASGIADYLRDRDFVVQTVDTVADAEECLLKRIPALVIVDWNLPDGNGGQLCRFIREKWAKLPVIFLTVRGDTRDIVRGFGLGADDYIVKPFALEILLLRIQAILRRSGSEGVNRLSCGPIAIDKDHMRVFYGEEEISLSALEYRLLLVLMENKNHTLLRNRLMEIIWDANGNFVTDNTLTVTMKRLRERLYNPSCLKTIRSFGYRLEDEVQ